MSIVSSKSLKEYLKYWQIDKPIFQSPVDIDHIFIPEPWVSYLERIILFSGQTSSIVTLSSPPGHCKSTIAKWLYRNIGVQSHEIVLLSLFREEEQSGWLLPKLAKYFGISAQNQHSLLELVADAIDQINQEGRLVTFIIDEAHKIKDPDAFSELHGLISLQSLVNLGINCILVGNNYLNEVISHTEQIKSRLNLTINFNNLSIQETAAYLYHSLASTPVNNDIFANDAIEAIYSQTSGIFSRLNALLENCLIEAFLKQKKTIDCKIVEEAARFLPSVNETHSAGPSTKPRQETVRRLADASQKVKSFRKNEKDGTGQSVELSSLFYKADDK